MNPEILIRIFDQPIAFHRCLVQVVGSVNASLLLGQLIFWTPRAASKEGWVFKTALELEEEIGLTRREQETARRALRNLALVREKKQGIPPKIYFQVDVLALKIALEQVFGGDANLKSVSSPNLADCAKSIWTEQQNQFDASGQNNTKNTSKEFSSSSPQDVTADKNTIGNHFDLRHDMVVWTDDDRQSADRLITDHGVEAIALAIKNIESEGKEPLPSRVQREAERAARARRVAMKKTIGQKTTPKVHLDVNPAAQAIGLKMLGQHGKSIINKIQKGTSK